MLDHTRLPLTTWFYAAFLVATDKRGMSAVLLDRQLDLGNHRTAWFMLHKLRRATVNANRTKLSGIVEIDGSYVGGSQPGLKGGRQRKGRMAAMVLAAVEVRTKSWTDQDGHAQTREVAGRLRVECVRAETSPWIAAFGGRAGETDQPRGWHRASARPYVFRFNRRQNPEAAFQTLLGLGSHMPRCGGQPSSARPT